MTGIRVLTLHQPWASLVAIGVKTVETRSWSTKYRGPLAIHAAVRKPSDTGPERDVGDYRLRGFGRASFALEGPGLPAFRSTPRLEGYFPSLGKILAVCTLVDVVATDGRDVGEDTTGLITWDGSGRTEHWHPWGEPTVPNLPGHRASRERHYVVAESQRPYGDYSPGRFAWLLDDIVPTTEECPSCHGDRRRESFMDPRCGCPDAYVVCPVHGPRAPGFGRLGVTFCATCQDIGHCAPIPFKGGQRLTRTWEPAPA